MTATPHPVTLVTLERDEHRLSLFATPDCLALSIRPQGANPGATFTLSISEARVLSALLIVAAEALQKALDTSQPSKIT